MSSQFSVRGALAGAVAGYLFCLPVIVAFWLLWMGLENYESTGREIWQMSQGMKAAVLSHALLGSFLGACAGGMRSYGRSLIISAALSLLLLVVYIVPFFLIGTRGCTDYFADDPENREGFALVFVVAVAGIVAAGFVISSLVSGAVGTLVKCFSDSTKR